MRAFYFSGCALVWVVAFCVSCTKIGPERQWNNPHDPGGVNWFPPAVKAPADTVCAINDSITLRASGTDANGTVTGFIWTPFGSSISDTVWLPNGLGLKWGRHGVGKHTLYVRAIDNDGIVSSPDSVSVTVHEYLPVLAHLKDSAVSQQASVSIHVFAFDTNNGITKYYWGTGEFGWADSTAAPDKVFSQPLGGPLAVRYGVMDKDGGFVADTFTIIFNRGPTSATLVEPSGKDTAQFIVYNVVDDEGKVRASFAGKDPDGSKDSLTYFLFIGQSAANLTLVYSGKGQTCTMEHLRALTTYSWKLRAKDLFGDSVESTGSFTTSAPPPSPRGMKLVRSGSKSFVMGQKGFDSSEVPVHTVSFSYHFWMDSTEVTRGNFFQILGLTDDQGAGKANLPMSGCTWFDAALYCNARSRLEKKDTVYSYQSVIGSKGKGAALNSVAVTMTVDGYRLPTEAEWEFACRANTQTLFFWGDVSSDAETYAWIKEYSLRQAHAVATKKANAFGFYDLAGNVWEWCNDWFRADYYAVSAQIADPYGPADGQERVLRGGSYLNSSYFAQSGSRSQMIPAASDASVGFRAVLVMR